MPRGRHRRRRSPRACWSASITPIESLLGAIVEVPLQAPPLVFGRGHDPFARLRDRLELLAKLGFQAFVLEGEAEDADDRLEQLGLLEQRGIVDDGRERLGPLVRRASPRGPPRAAGSAACAPSSPIHVPGSAGAHQDERPIAERRADGIAHRARAAGRAPDRPRTVRADPGRSGAEASRPGTRSARGSGPRTTSTRTTASHGSGNATRGCRVAVVHAYSKASKAATPMARPPATRIGQRTRRQTGPERRSRRRATNPTSDEQHRSSRGWTRSRPPRTPPGPARPQTGLADSRQQPESRSSRPSDRVTIAAPSATTSHRGRSRWAGEESTSSRAARTRS